MRVLVTGGLGFLGGRVALHLHQCGHQVLCGTRRTVISRDLLSNIRLVEMDWHDGHALSQLCGEIDVVIHAAGMNAQECETDPVAALEFNGLATARLVEAATSSRVKRFVYLSTAHVYADRLVGTFTEESCPRNLHPYATSHLAGENAVLGARQRGLIDGIVLRLSNVFGAPVHKTANCWMLLVNDLCRQAVQSRGMLLRSNGIQRRDFVPMAVVCRVLEKMSEITLGETLPPILNVGSGEARQLVEMAKEIQNRCKLVLGYEPELLQAATNTDIADEMLFYKQERLERLKLTTFTNNAVELDKLLLFCNEVFNRRNREDE